MMHLTIRRLTTLMLTVITGGLVVGVSGQSAPSSAPDPAGNWTYYGGDARNWRYQPFDQINAANFKRPAGRVALPHRQPWAEPRLPARGHADHGQRRRLRGRRRHAPIGGGARRGDRHAAVDSPGGRRPARGVRAARRLRAAASPTGPTAARNGSSTSRPATGMKALNAKTGQLIPSFGTGRRRRSEEGLRSGSEPLRAATTPTR